MQIARAAFRLVAYDNGYLSEFCVNSILNWDKDVIEKVMKGEDASIIFANTTAGKPKYVNTLEASHPGYIHTLFYKAIRLEGPKVGFQELLVAMNEISAVASETRPSLTLSRLQLNT